MNHDAPTLRRLSARRTPVVAGVTLCLPRTPTPAHGSIVIQVDGAESAHLDVKRTVPLASTASKLFDVGADLGSTVSSADFDRRPFKFSGGIEKVEVSMK